MKYCRQLLITTLFFSFFFNQVYSQTTTINLASQCKCEVLSGTIAPAPGAPAANAGNLYVNTADGDIYSYDGTNWIKVGNDATPTAGDDINVTGTDTINIESQLDFVHTIYSPAQNLTLGAGGNSFMRAWANGHVGIGNLPNSLTPAAGLHVSHDDGTIMDGTFGAGQYLAAGSGTRLVWSSKNASFRAGTVNGNQWDETNIGEQSTAFGSNTTASGRLSFAGGSGSIASGIRAFAFGASAEASGTNALAFGTNSEASKPNTISLGRETVSSGNSAMATGEGTLARSRGEMVVGMFSTDYTPSSTTVWNSNDRIFNVGIGQNATSRKDALTMFKSGRSRFNGFAEIVADNTVTDEALNIDNSGTGIGQVLVMQNSTSTATGQYFRQDGLGIGQQIIMNNPSNNARGIDLIQQGNGDAFYISINNATSSRNLIGTDNQGLGHGVYVRNTNSNNTRQAVGAFNVGLGQAIYAGGTLEGGAIRAANKRTGSINWNTATCFNCPESAIVGTTDDGRAGVEGQVWKANSSDLRDVQAGFFVNYSGAVNGGSLSTYSLARVAYIDGGGTPRKIDGTGVAGTIVTNVSNEPILMSAVESPEILFTDYGIGQLVNGKAVIQLDPNYTHNIIVDSKNPMKVFIQLEGECNGVYVTNKSEAGFEVIELKAGNSNVPFSYEVVANRANVTENGNHFTYDSSKRFAPGPKDLPSRGETTTSATDDSER